MEAEINLVAKVGRETDKVDKYLLKMSDGDCLDSGRSRYYRIGGKIIRVSDHIGTNSDGEYHIIIRPNGYLVHHPSTGTINIVNYEQVKEFLRVFKLFPFADVRFTRPKQTTEVKTVKDQNSVLGVPASLFTPGQLNVIKLTAKKALQTYVESQKKPKPDK